MMVASRRDLWTLARQVEVDPEDLAHAIEAQAEEPAPDYRTRLLIRDSVEGLKRCLGEQSFAEWLAASPQRSRIERICREEFAEIGFPSLPGRIMDKTTPERIEQYLRELGSLASRPVRLLIGGSCALILSQRLSRHTEDIDVVDETPAELRTQYSALERLEQRYGLHLAHFQSHYLPDGWQNRLHYLDAFGNLQVYTVDVYDIFAGKLFSAREKDRDDLRALAPHLDKATLVQRWRDTTARLQADASLKQQAETNWYIVFGEGLPQ